MLRGFTLNDLKGAKILDIIPNYSEVNIVLKLKNGKKLILFVYSLNGSEINWDTSYPA